MRDKPTIVAVVPNLMFSTRIEDAARTIQAEVVLAADAATFTQALLNGARLALIDANTREVPWLDWVQAVKANPAISHIPVIAFGSHTDVALREHSLAAGVDRYLARSNFVAGLPEIMAAAVREVTDDPCGESLPAGVVRGLEEFNTGRYFEQHETLELVWRAELRPVRNLYRGILQIGVACYQLERGNAAGAVKLIDRATRWLQPFRPTCQSVDVERLLADAKRLRNEIVHAGFDNVAGLDRSLFPKVHWRAGD
jgi:CheY-like chemotaxis protein